MASVFVLLEAFNRKEAAALGFFPCATASFFYAKMPFGYIFGKKYTIFGYIFGVKSGYLRAIKKPQEYAA